MKNFFKVFKKNKEIIEDVKQEIICNEPKYKYLFTVNIHLTDRKVIYTSKTNSTNVFSNSDYKKLWLWYYLRESDIYIINASHNKLPYSQTIKREDIRTIETIIESNE